MVTGIWYVLYAWWNTREKSSILFEETTAMKKTLTGKNYVKNECNVCYNPKGGKIIILQKLRVWTIEMYQSLG